MPTEEQETISRILATDLDGTLIPLADSEQNRADLPRLKECVTEYDITLVFVTGRHFASVENAIREYDLPLPDWIICDVGTSIYRCHGQKKFELVAEYHEHQAELTTGVSLSALREKLSGLRDLRLQEREKQGRFKLSYYAIAADLEQRVEEIESTLRMHKLPFTVIHSVDPFNQDGLIDLLPVGVSKAYALAWWSQFVGHSGSDVIFAGDSGNDFAALTADYRAIVVANADRRLAEKVQAYHAAQGTMNRLLLAENEATSGVLEGLHWFGAVTNKPDS